MKIEVVGHRVMIDPDVEKEELDDTYGALKGFKLVGESIQREKAATTKGTIVGVGGNAWKAFDDGLPWAKIGDKVYFAKYGGKWVEIEGKEYVIVNDEDIQAIVKEEEA